eukprot:CAMPEP_0113598102 /NCGR_PEP_ID=MMETSP0015_2-20120614/41383_1 /TAXON_ID=2838 /ORGANISM="Odontella" /LENGTH=84 /DNA_ID=CAMNT_0000506047 /DNA_START=505 /DNA_END=755 /DNA_ORIENTATION=+ /assembly_acc=CAM_ASM_000160
MAPREATNPFPDQYLTLDYESAGPVVLPHDDGGGNGGGVNPAADVPGTPEPQPQQGGDPVADAQNALMTDADAAGAQDDGSHDP